MKNVIIISGSPRVGGNTPMPWSVKIVWWWYLTLACAGCVPLVFCLVKCDPFGRGEFAICGNFSREEAMKLAASLNGKLVVK